MKPSTLASALGRRAEFDAAIKTLGLKVPTQNLFEAMGFTASDYPFYKGRNPVESKGGDK